MTDHQADRDLPATVRTFEADASGGSVFLDDGTVLGFDAAAFAVGGLRFLRPGQRVRIRLRRGPDGERVQGVTLATFAWDDRAVEG